MTGEGLTALRIVSVAVMTALFLIYQKKKRNPAVPRWQINAWKAASTGIAVINGVVCAFTLNQGWAWLLAIGVLTGMVADVLINHRLIWGGLAFGIGHLLYIVAFWLKSPPGMASLIVMAALTVVGGAYLYFMRNHIRKNLCGPFAVYGLIIAAMTACAITQNNAARVGAALFVASDMLLMYNGAGKGNRATDYISLGMYFSGQLLIGMSPLL